MLTTVKLPSPSAITRSPRSAVVALLAAPATAPSTLTRPAATPFAKYAVETVNARAPRTSTRNEGTIAVTVVPCRGSWLALMTPPNAVGGASANVHDVDPGALQAVGVFVGALT